MYMLMSLYVFALFFILSPGVLLKIPSRGSTGTVALVHGILFAIIFHFTHKFVWIGLYNTHGRGYASA